MNIFSRKSERGFTLIETVMGIAVIGLISFGTLSFLDRMGKTSQANALSDEFAQLQDASTRCYDVPRVEGGCAATNSAGWDLGNFNSPDYTGGAGDVNPVLRYLVMELVHTDDVNVIDTMTDLQMAKWNQWTISRVNLDTLSFKRDVADMKYAKRAARKLAVNAQTDERPYEVNIVSDDESGGLALSVDLDDEALEVQPDIASVVVYQGIPADVIAYQNMIDKKVKLAMDGLERPIIYENPITHVSKTAVAPPPAPWRDKRPCFSTSRGCGSGEGGGGAN